MIRRPPRATRPDTLFPYTTLFRSMAFKILPARSVGRGTARSVVEGKYAGCAPFPPPCFAWSPSPSLDGEESDRSARSEEHTSELQSLMRISYAVFCLKKKKNKHTTTIKHHT